jgi:hypothetical protein
MSVFGPKYPPKLQALMNHAERFCELLARLEGRRPGRGEGARKWLMHRRQEIEVVLALVVSDLAADRIGLKEAIRSAASYLDDLHVGARSSLGLGAPLECCVEDEALTVAPARRHEAVTVEALTRVVPKEARASGACETWFDPSALLDMCADAHAPVVTERARSGLSETPASAIAGKPEEPESRAPSVGLSASEE